ncbi:MAG TPA: hypothetical protein VFE24_02775 [Pirellulales bacterium]|jgi:O-acetyl-ADP-ribose deacetylase (regulator of RNase III)|nr:hypothetical protein [Pirellulales bacterium]
MPIEFVTGDATRPIGEGSKVIVHVCNDIGVWGKGFVMALSKRWKEPEKSYRRWHRNRETEQFHLGAVQFVNVETQICVANLIGQRDIYRKNGIAPIRYPAIGEGLECVARFAVENEATVHMPRIGCGLAGGIWNQIEPLIESALCSQGILTFVYDLP